MASRPAASPQISPELPPLAYATPGPAPVDDQMLVVDLPGERLRCRVIAVADHDHAVVEISSQPMAKSHSYRKGDTVAVERQLTDLGEIWEAMDERLLAMRSRAEKAVPTARASAKKSAAKKRGR